MEKSLQQITNAFSNFADIHKGISQFYPAILEQKITARGWKYPLMISTIGVSSVNNGEIRYNMNIYFFDMPATEEEHVKKLSNTFKLCEDFITYFNKNHQDFGFQLVDNVSATPAKASFEDGVIGWNMPIIVQTRSSQNESELPI